MVTEEEKLGKLRVVEETYKEMQLQELKVIQELGACITADNIADSNDICFSSWRDALSEFDRLIWNREKINKALDAIVMSWSGREDKDNIVKSND